MDRPTDIPVCVLVDGVRVCAHLRAAVFSPYVLALDTTMPDYGIELHSTYTGHRGTRTRVSHLLLAPGVQETIAVGYEHESMPVVYERQRCLYDHLACLQDLFHRVELRASIQIGDEALAAVER